MRKILVAYFSASGTTAAVARNLAKAADADLIEIQPEQPYTPADLNWMDKQSRSTLEMKDRACRPPLAATPNLSGYDLIFVGFPVWWYREPSVIDTFMESADFTGKTVVPFCTSGGSGLGDAAKNLQSLAPGATVLDGMRFPSSAAVGVLRQWVCGFTKDCT